MPFLWQKKNKKVIKEQGTKDLELPDNFLKTEVQRGEEKKPASPHHSANLPVHFFYDYIVFCVYCNGILYEKKMQVSSQLAARRSEHETSPGSC